MAQCHDLLNNQVCAHVSLKDMWLFMETFQLQDDLWEHLYFLPPIIITSENYMFQQQEG